MVTPVDLHERAQGFRNRHPQPSRATPPEEQGRRLATLERPKDREEIRINWCEYEGNPYLNIRVWAEGHDGRFWPQRERGFSIRVRELPDVAEAIAEAMTLAEGHLADRPGVAGGRRESVQAPRDDFDEFEEAS
jgi:hypothetical protein